jgi:dTMP kinase
MFIVYEGIDGCGKGTQIKKSVPYIFDLSKNYDVLLTREPTRDFGEIREKMRRGTNVKEDGFWYLDMFVKDRTNHIDRYIKPALANGTHVLSDRFKHSTLAYQPLQGVPLKKVIRAHQKLLNPDLTLIYDCPAPIAFERRKKEGATDVFDKDLAFQEKLRSAYLDLPKILKGEHVVVIDGSKSICKVFAETKKHLDMLLKK